MKRRQIIVVVIFIVFILVLNNLEGFSNVEEKSESFIVLVEGEVVNPGEYIFEQAVSVYEIIQTSGGFSEFADKSSIDTYQIIDSNYSLTIATQKVDMILVEISGEVITPGIYSLNEGSRINDLVMIAGGFTTSANQDVNLVEELKDGQRVVIEKNETEYILDYIVVEIKGEVLNPGVYKLPSNSITNDLVYAAGGLSQRANIDNLNLAEILDNEQLVIVGKNTSIIAESDLININYASKTELENLPGIGSVLSQRIIDYRKIKMFASIEELLNLENFNNSTYEKIKELITV